MKKTIIRTLWTCVIVLGIVIPATAAPVLTPLGLNPGDMYQLAFVTSTTRDATSSDIADYNAFVQGVANNEWLGGGSILDGIQWTAIASTATTNARDTALVVGPVYNLGGEKVADSFADMWDFSIDNPIEFTESGNVVNQLVWTGTRGNGFRHDPPVLGATPAVTGASSLQSGSWIDHSVAPSSAQLPLYALSEKLTVPNPVPTPSAFLLMGTGLLGLIGWRKWGNKT